MKIIAPIILSFFAVCQAQSKLDVCVETSNTKNISSFFKMNIVQFAEIPPKQRELMLNEYKNYLRLIGEFYREDPCVLHAADPKVFTNFLEYVDKERSGKNFPLFFENELREMSDEQLDKTCNSWIKLKQAIKTK